MQEDNRNAYSEVVEILKLIDDEKLLEALPMEMLEVIKSKTNPEYMPKISLDVPLDKQNLQPETLSILSWIAIKYWNAGADAKSNDLLNNDTKQEDEISNIDKKEIEETKQEKELEQNTANVEKYAEIIMNGASSIEIKRKALADGFKPLIVDGINKVIQGFTTLDELNRKLVIY